jgi:hypothetical protein
MRKAGPRGVREQVANRARQGLVTLGDQSILFAAAMRGIFQRVD